MKSQEINFLSHNNSGQPATHDIIALMEQFMSRFQQSPLSSVLQAETSKPKETDLQEKRSKLNKDKQGDDRDDSSLSDKKMQKIPDLILFMAQVDIPLSQINQKMFFNLFLFALVF